MPDVDSRKQTDSPEEYWKREFSPDEETGMTAAAQRGAAEDAEIKGLQDSLDGPDAAESGSDKLKGGQKIAAGSDSGTMRGGQAARDKAAQIKNEGPEQSSDKAAGGGGRFDKVKNFGRKLIDKKNRKKAAIGAAVGTGVGGLIFGGMLMLAPLKLLSTMTNLQNNFFSASDQASSKMGNQMLNHYIVRKVIPGMQANAGCNSTRTDKSCAALGDTNSPVAALWVAWRDSNFEGNLAKNHDIEIQKRNGRYYVRAPGLNQELDLGKYVGGSRVLDGKPFAKLSQNDARRVMMKAMNKESWFKQLRYKWNVGKLMERKHNIRRCGVVKPCIAKIDKLKDTIAMRQNNLKLRLVERYIMPKSEMVATALTCALSDFNCADPGSSDNNGERLSPFQIETRNTLIEYRRIYGEKPLAELEAEAEKVRKFGATGYIIRRIAGDTVGTVAGKLLGKFVPIAGWIDGLSSAFQTGKKAAVALKHMNYAMSSTMAVGVTGMLLTTVDEMKTGEGVDPVAFGSVSKVFDEVPGGDQGGGAFEATPLYDQMFNGQQGQTASVFDLFSPKAYAAENEPAVKAYTCEDGKLVPAGESVCPVMSFGAFGVVFQIAEKISAVFNNPALSPVALLSDIWEATLGKLWTAFENLVGAVGSALMPDFLVEETKKWIQAQFIDPYMPDQLGENPSGGRMGEIAAFGMSVMANDDAQFNQGGRVLSEAETRAVYAAMREERAAEFAAKPFYARMFDTEDTQSLVSRMALSMPSGSAGMQGQFSSFIANPLDIVSRSFSAIFPSRKANAAYYVSNPFRLPTYGYPAAGSGDPVADEIFAEGFDPDEYTVKRDCGRSTLRQEWGDKATELDENTAMPLQKTLEPCMLIAETVSAAGGVFNTDLLLKSATAGANGSAPAAGAPTGPVADAFLPSDTMACPVGSDGGVQDGYNNGALVKIRICDVQGTKINARMASNLDALLNAARSQGVNIAGGSDFRTMAAQTSLYNSNCPGGRCRVKTAKPGYSNHQMGLAIDFKYNNATICYPKPSAQCVGNAGFDWMKTNAGKYGFVNYPVEAWHWSVDGT